jgi:broad specificity phosphatase PhoE
MQTIVLIRHGYPVSWDQNLKVRGTPAHLRIDSGLAAIGVRQAQVTAAHLAALGGVEGVISSPFRRCLETADVIAAACACPVAADWRVGEVLLSAALGSPFSLQNSMDPDWAERREKAGKPAHPESDATIKDRVTKILAELKSTKPFAQRIAIVSHAIILTELFNHMTGKSAVMDWHPCAITVLTKAKPLDRQWRLNGVPASCKHLGADDRVEPVAQIAHSYHPLDSRS